MFQRDECPQYRPLLGGLIHFSGQRYTPEPTVARATLPPPIHGITFSRWPIRHTTLLVYVPVSYIPVGHMA